jgi:hypothetical protein
MNRKIKLSAAVVATLMLSILAVNIAMAATNLGTTSNLTPAANAANVKVSAENGVEISAEQAQDAEQLKEMAPATPEEAEKSIYPIRTRFLMYTHDGVHIMWGVYGNGRFVGTDNLGKRCWGIYGRGVFAGFYDGEFFWGKYDNGSWKAQYLFGLENSYGKYVTFPVPAVSSADPSTVGP